MKKPIAMKCNQEQFELIKPKLEQEGLLNNVCGDFNNYPYLSNPSEEIKVRTFSNHCKETMNSKREIHETWNEKVFLEACGIEVEELKEESFVITRDQIIILNTDGNKDVRKCMREWFSSALEPEKKELVVEAEKWYKGTVDFESLIFIKEVKKLSDYNQLHYYGFIFGKWKEKDDYIANTDHEESLIEAPQQEVEEALKAEILKRYKVGDRVNCLKCGNLSLNCELNLDSFDHYFKDDELWVSFNESKKIDSMVCVYSKGIFAEIIQPKKMTKAEAEKMYNIEIV